MMGYRIRRVDNNQKEIVKAFRKLGAKVEILSEVGGGTPDLVIGVKGRMRWIEIKDGSKSPSRRKLTEEQLIFHREWIGYVDIVESVEDVVKIVQEAKKWC